MGIENIILSSAIASVNGLASKDEDYIQSVSVWVISLTNIRVEARKNAESASQGLNSILYKGGYISSQAIQGQHKSWPFLWFSGNAKHTSYEKVEKVHEMIPGGGRKTTVSGTPYPLATLAKDVDGEIFPYNINLALTGNLLTPLFPEGSQGRTACQHQAGAMPMLEARMRDLAASAGEVQLHITVGMTPETWAASSVKKMYKSSASLEDKSAFEVMLQERDILGLKWVLPGDKTFVPGLNLGQIVNLNSERVKVEAVKEVITPDEVLPKDAQVLRFLNKNYGKFIKEKGLDHTQEATMKAFIGTLTGSFLKWTTVSGNEDKAIKALSKWSPEGKTGPRIMGSTATEMLEKGVANPIEEPKQAGSEPATSVRTSRMGGRINKGSMASLGASLAGDFDED